MDLKAVAANPEAKQMGERLFLTYCAQCHGSDAKGAKGFPNLADSDWLYGGSAEQITASIAEGRNGMMPAWGPQLGAEGVKDVASYVRSLSGLSVDSVRAAKGKEIFATNCAACHGADGKGMQAIGAPNLTDKVWLYGSSEASVIETITKGRQNQMPTWKNFLGQPKIHLLAAYVYGLSPHDEPAAAPAEAVAAPAAAPAAEAAPAADKK
jgi:cytochrome c oxidase cbb3-type subunit 3